MTTVAYIGILTVCMYLQNVFAGFSNFDKILNRYLEFSILLCGYIGHFNYSITQSIWNIKIITYIKTRILSSTI